MEEKLISQADLKAVLCYEPISGMFRWASKRRGVSSQNRPGTVGLDGYRRIRVLGKAYRASRLAWLYVYGVWPQGYVDHIDGDRSHDAISNLRIVDALTNAQNQRRAHRDNQSGQLLGASLSDEGRWVAQITANRKTRHIGTFNTAEEAHQAYLVEKRRVHKGCTI